MKDLNKKKPSVDNFERLNEKQSKKDKEYVHF